MRHRFIDLLEQSPVIPAVKAEAALPCALACESRVLFLLGGDLLTPKVSDFVSRAATLGALLTSVLCTIHLYVDKLTFLEALPLYDLGLSWILPAVIFAAAAALLAPLFRSRESGSPVPQKEH